MSKPKFYLTILALTASLLSVNHLNSANADTTISVGGASLSIPTSIYQPMGYDSVRADITFSNNSGVELLSIGYSVTDAYGKVLTSNSKIGVPAGTAGLISSNWYGTDFNNAEKPLTMTLIVKRFGGLGDLITSGTLTLLTKPSTSPAPTVTVTATPAPAPTVTVTATPASNVANWVYNQLEANKLQIEILEKDNKSLKAKIKKVCAAKPKPKGC